MNRNQRILELASALRPLEVRNYAESRNWQLIPGMLGRQWLLKHKTEQLRQVQIPMDADTSGFGEAMLDVVRRFADIERREPEELLADLQHPDADTLRFRIVAPETQGGQIPLAADISLREGARRALLAAASSVVNPALHHPRLSRSEAEQLVRASLAGQTEIGSYAIKIVCPLNAVDEPSTMPTLFDRAPATHSFVRRTTTLLMKATAELAASIEQDKLDELIRKNQEHPTLSWNLCDALIRMRPDRGKIDLSISWAADPAEPPPDDVPTEVSFPTEYFPQVERAAELLRPSAAESRAQLLVGTVDSLGGDVDESGRRAGDVILSVLSEDGGSLTARASLTADQYDIAADAHMKGLRLVLMRGILRRGLRIGRIENVERFEIIDRP